jgi:hypothetical protein
MRRTEHGARNAATGRRMAVLARCGYAAKGVVYLIIGVIAIQVALGARGAVTDQKGTLHTILAQPFGHILLGVVAVGLFSFALWYFVLARQSYGLVLLGIVAVGLFAYGLYSLVEARDRRIGKA